MTKTPFALAYLDWCKANKDVKTVKETENRDWVREFYHSPAWGRKPITGVDYAIAMGIDL